MSHFSVPKLQRCITSAQKLQTVNIEVPGLHFSEPLERGQERSILLLRMAGENAAKRDRFVSEIGASRFVAFTASNKIRKLDELSTWQKQK